MTHMFDVEIAKEYGADVAVIVSNFEFWILKNKANKAHIHDGKVWTYNSIKAFSELFPYWTENQIRRILSTMKEKGIIETGNFNKVGYDRTTWYTFSEPFLQNHKWICAKPQMDLSETTNGFVQNHEPIPDNKPDSKPIYTPFLEKWNSMDGLRKHKEEPVQANWKKAHTDKVKLYGEEETIKAIENYAIILNDKSSFFNYKWSLWEFIARGLDKFLDESEPFTNYKNDKASKTQTTQMRF